MNKDKIYQILDEYYGISIQKIETINRLFFRKSYLIFDGADRIVLKKYPPDFSEDLLKNIWMFTSNLNQCGIRTMELLEMKDGSFIYQEAGSCYVAYKYIDGYRMEPGDSFEIGKALKKFHDISKKIACEKFGNLDRQICIEQIIDDIRKFSLYREESDVARRIDDNIDTFLQCTKSYRLSDNILIHGDFTLNNILNCGEEKSIIDLDSVRWGNAIEDMSCFALSLLYFGSKELKLMPRYKEIADFITGYYQNNNTIPKYIINELVENIKVHCVIELAGQAHNFQISRRYPGNESYIDMLANVVITEADNLKEQLEKYF